MYVHNTLKCKRKVRLFKGICALTCMIKFVKQIVPLSVGSELLQEAKDAFALM